MKRYEDFLLEKAKNLSDAGIPESIYSFLFKKKILKNNDSTVNKITKKELKEKLSGGWNSFSILAFSDDDDWVFIDLFTNRHIEFIGGVEQSEGNKLSNTKILSKIPAKYKIFIVDRNTNMKHDREINNQKPSRFGIISGKLTKTQEKFLLKKLKELKSDIVKNIDVAEYRTHTSEDTIEYNRLKAVAKLNQYIDDIDNQLDYNIGTYSNSSTVIGGAYVYHMLIEKFELTNYLSNNFDTPEEQIKSNLIRITKHWKMEDFLNNNTRTIITDKERREQKAEEFNL